ncbi:protein CREBRF homolog isoform X1 [Daphnia pulicaria]|uniref:protein CREBRF homolog isoform X1 n=1 Tax=Daphnia pulicaria TaxID=35523 RepID=UPI001EEA1F94|nr:protein CREBRF homolog isoform X1 [Daphnia pulicaria]
MTTAPRGGMGNGPMAGGGIFDPSVLFDLDDILMAGDCSNDMQTSLVHTPIKEEPEFDQDDRYVHSPIGLPIPNRNGGVGMLGYPSIKQEVGNSSSPAGGMWGGPSQMQRTMNSVPFPVTPFNTPSQGQSVFMGPDLRNFFLSGTSNNHHQHLNSVSNPTLSVSIKEELTDLETDLETMKAISMFPMEEDDIFQVDKADLIQGPTLAELNANDESLLTDFNFDDFVMPTQMTGRYTKPFNGADNVGADRFRMAELNAAFSASPSLSHFELHRNRNVMSGMANEDDYSQLGTSQMGFDLEQLPSVDMPFPNAGTPFSLTGVESNAGMSSTTVTSPLSASLPANFGHVTLSKLTRRTEEGGRVKPPPPYPTSPPQKSTNNSALQELLSIRSPGRLPSPNPTGGSHSPSPTTQRPTYSGGARQRTSNSGSSSSGGASGQSIPRPNLAATNPLLLARLSSSAPGPSILGGNAAPGESSTWQRREPRNRLFSTSSLVEEVHGSASSISTVGILSPGSFDFSHDEGFDSEDDSDHYEDFDDSDSDSGGSDEEGRGEAHAGSSSGKKERFFWQYNVQAKGPKGHKISLAPETVDPHVLNKVQDPVFSPYCSVDGIKHSGKARRGDGNDLTPNPRKLHSIGRELDKLNRLINDMTPVSELPMAVRPKSRKEKNKLASRACRLKKKAQHEANKVKLYGLEQEHRKLMAAISQTKLMITAKYDVMIVAQNPSATAQQGQDASTRLERIAKTLTKVKIAGHSTDFVNRVLERVKAGEPSGGLDEI